ncbi:P-loop NTPase [Puerhibacterium sp. TATVAM-FAB25]|uniref:P-loop NTPase n=1 Tax=Puerhibacterium sp. TATVAM-FAB25 TaxID=3093699 RepID=UPI00397817A7
MDERTRTWTTAPGGAAGALGAPATGGRSRVVAVVGACGGAGTSTVAAALAHGLRRAAGRGVLVDLDAPGPGVEVLLGVEGEPGARWPELAAARGEVDGRGLVAALPRWGSVPVLSASRLRPEAPDDDVVLDVCAGLLRAGEHVVLDLPRRWTPAVRALLAGGDDVLLVAPLTMPGAAGAVAAATAVAAARGGRGPDDGAHQAGGRGRPADGPGGRASARLVCRRSGPGRVDPADLETLVGMPLAAVVPADRRLAAAVERGEGPPVGRRTALGRLGDDLAAAVGKGEGDPGLGGAGLRAARRGGAAGSTGPLPAATRSGLHGGAGAA